MELTKSIAQWREQSSGQWLGQANLVLPPVVIVISVVLIAAQAVDLMWTLLERPAEQASVPPAMVAERGDSGSQRNWSLDNAYGLFGEAPSPDAAAAISANVLYDAPETDLNLRLTGLLVAQELPVRNSVIVPEAGAAIIAVNRGQQQALRTGEKIEGVGNASLYIVLEDRVLLDRGGGNYESLFYDPDGEEPQSIQLRSNVSQRQNTAAAAPLQPAAAAGAAEQLSGLASTLGQHIVMEPHAENGSVIGMRLHPRNDSEMFSRLGFEPGDILLDINGLRATDLQNMSAIGRALSETSQASVKIRRNDAEQTLTVNLNDIQQLVESRQ